MNFQNENFSALAGLSNSSGNNANAVELLLNQVKALQDQVTQLTSKQPTSEISVPPASNAGFEAMASMPNSGMDLKTMMAARMQGLNVPAYGATNNMAAQGVMGAQGMIGAQGMVGSQGMMGAQGMLGTQGMIGNQMQDESPTVWITGVPEDFRNTKAIANILGNFGNVMKVKFSRKKPDGVLVQMQDSSQAERCVNCLNYIELEGGKLKVSPSKITNVTIVQHEDPELGRDFSRGFDHRFRDLNSKFTQICLNRVGRPTNILMVNNIPVDKMSEAKAYIIESGFDVEEFKEGPKKKNDTEGETNKKTTHYAFVEFTSAGDAIKAVARLHNTLPSSIGEGKMRRLAFTFTSKTSAA